MKVFEMAGQPKTGKTIVSSALEREIRADGLVVRHTHGGGRYLHMKVKGTPAFNMAVACRNVLSLLTVRDIDDESVLIMDRGPIDSLIFSMSLKQKGVLDDQDLAVIRDLVLHPAVLSRIDHVFLFVAPNETLVLRENDIPGSKEGGGVHDLFTMDAHRAATMSVANILAEHGRPVSLFDTADGAIQAASQTIQIVRRSLERLPVQ